MFRNYEFYKRLLDTKNVLDNYIYFEKILKEEPNDIFAQDGIKFCLQRQEELESTCEQHIPIVLKINKNIKIYDFNTNKYVPAKFKRCICCGKFLPYEIVTTNDINFTICDANDTINYNAFNQKYIELLDLAIEIATNSVDKNDTIENFKEAIRDYDVKTYIIKRKIN